MSRFFRISAFAVCLLTVLACFTVRVHAQSATGTILGKVIDPQGAAVPNANVTAKNVDTGIERNTTTTAEGLYQIPSLQPGVYDVRVEASGFAKAQATGQKIQVGDLHDLNFTLSLGTVASEVRVTAETPLVETTKTDISNTINDTQIESLPVFPTPSIGGVASFTSKLDDYATLATTSPGVRFDQSANSSDLIGPGAYNDRGNVFNVDGVNITDQVVSTRDALGASLDEVKEFQVITNNYTAEYGEAGNVIINVVTKSGSNEFHGVGHAFFRGRNFGASNYFYNEFDPNAPFRRAPFQKQIGGVTAGGPFVKDRTFWLVNYEQGHEASPLTLFPNGVGTTVSSPTNEILWTARVDHEVFKNHNLMLRFNEHRIFQDNLLVQVPITAEPSALTTFVVHDHLATGALVSQVNPRVVNEGRFLWHRFENALPDKSSVPGVRTSTSYSGAAFCCPQGGLQNRYQYLDNVSWINGTHTFKFGVNTSHFPYNSLFQQFHFGEWDLRNNTLTVGFGPGFVQTTDTIYGLYAQDSWKIRPSLTFNYGLRYDYEDGAFRGGPVPKPGGGCFQGNGIISACSTDKNNLQPRVGLAWSPGYESGFLHGLFGGAGKTVIRASAAEITELAYLNVSLDSLNFDGVTLLTQSIPFTCTSQTAGCADPIGQFFPNLPPAGVLAAQKPADFFGRVRPIAPNLHNPETHHYSLDIARQLGNDFVADVGYIGVLGIGQFGEVDLNYPVITPDPAHPGFFYFQTQPPVDPLLRLTARPDNRFKAVRTNQNSRTSAYHGVFLNVTKRFSHHFQAQGNYTFSHTLASAEDFYGTSEPGDPRNIRADRGPAQNDIRHVSNFTFIYDTAKLTQQSLLNHIVNNWKFGIIGTVHSGPHYPISTGEGPFTGSVFPGVGAETEQRPNVLSDGTIVATNVASNSGANLQISQGGVAACQAAYAMASLTPDCPAATTFLAPSATVAGGGPIDSLSGDPVDFQFINGNLQRDVGVGDWYHRFDVSVGKTFTIRERIGLEFRADIINVLNHPNFILFNGLDVTDLFSVGMKQLCATCGPPPPGSTMGTPVFAPDRNCVNCLNAFTGQYIGAGGRVLHLSDLQHGRVSRNLASPVFLGLGDPTTADIPRQIQATFRIKW